jgi:long-chain acyl-CoA synthetase
MLNVLLHVRGCSIISSYGGKGSMTSLDDKIHHARSLQSRDFTDKIVPFANIGQLLAVRVNERSDASFLTALALATQDKSVGTERQFSYREMFAAACAFAARLEDNGLQTGDRVATFLTNGWQTVVAYFGAWMLGVTVVPINVGETPDRVVYVLENSEAKLVLSCGEHAQTYTALREAHSNLPAFLDIENPVEGEIGDTCHFPLDFPPDTESLIIYTSGTTGAPKGVVLDHYNLMADAHVIAEWHNFTPNDRAMLILPIHHVNGIVVTLMTPLYSGGSVVLNRKFSASHYWNIIEQERCTWGSVVPTILAFLCEKGADISQHDLSRFRHLICGAGPLTVEMAHKFDRQFGVRVVHGYGLSETTCYSCFLPTDLDPQSFNHWMFECGFPSIGVPLPVNEMEIHNSEGESLLPDVRGEIVIRGHNVMREYFKRPDANEDTFKHGWFRSGDEGFYRVGADGHPYFFITGRIKELIIRGGINLSPFDIDEVLSAISGVKAAMAVGFENDFYGEEVGAYVQRAEGAAVTAEDILAACRQALPFSKSPKVVVFGDTFPVTSTGKYQRNKLKPLFAEWRGTQFRE